MKKLATLGCFAVAALILTAALDARADDGKQLPVGSLIGEYDGNMEIHMVKTLEFSYQAEILPVADDLNAVTLVAHCSRCDTKDWKRNKCKVTEVSDVIKFACKTKAADEEYVFNGDRLKMSGFGAKYPYSISAKKLPQD
jgi:hypothetical protein